MLQSPIQTNKKKKINFEEAQHFQIVFLQGEVHTITNGKTKEDENKKNKVGKNGFVLACLRLQDLDRVMLSSSVFLVTSASYSDFIKEILAQR